MNTGANFTLLRLGDYMKLPLVEQSKRSKLYWSNVVSSGYSGKRVPTLLAVGSDRSRCG